MFAQQGGHGSGVITQRLIMVVAEITGQKVVIKYVRDDRGVASKALAHPCH